MNQQLESLRQEVTQNRSLIASAVSLIHGLADQVEAAKEDPVALTALVQEMRDNNAALASAVTANTGTDTGGDETGEGEGTGTDETETGDEGATPPPVEVVDDLA